MKAFDSEKDLAKIVVDWLRDMHWEVYQEVQIHSFGAVADIVAVQGKLVWVIETKLAFGLAVIEQAEDWRNYAHYTSIAVPSGRGGYKSYSLGKRICDIFGVGWLTVRMYEVIEQVHPALNRKAMADRIRQSLTEEHKTFAEAGNNRGHHWTPFQATCLDVSRKVHDKPGISMKEMLDGLKHHYASSATARSCLLKWISLGKVKGVRMERKGRAIELYPDRQV